MSVCLSIYLSFIVDLWKKIGKSGIYRLPKCSHDKHVGTIAKHGYNIFYSESLVRKSPLNTPPVTLVKSQQLQQRQQWQFLISFSCPSSRRCSPTHYCMWPTSAHCLCAWCSSSRRSLYWCGPSQRLEWASTVCSSSWSGMWVEVELLWVFLG